MTDVLISADALCDLPEHQRPVLLDVRWTLAGPDHDAYLAGHLPGAVFCDLDTHLAQHAGTGGRHPLPNPADLAATLASWGITPNTDVVVYDDASSLAASRAWWCLRWVGVRNVRILDGGLGAWTRRAGDLIAGPGMAPEPVTAWTPQVAMPSVTAEDVAGLPVSDDAAAATSESTVLVDVRTPQRFRGETEPIDPVAGHIPGAVNVPITDLLDDEGAFADADAIRKRLTDVIGSASRVVAYCGSGVTASQCVAAARIAGIPAELYPGSWSEWITDPTRPIATSS